MSAVRNWESPLLGGRRCTETYGKNMCTPISVRCIVDDRKKKEASKKRSEPEAALWLSTIGGLFRIIALCKKYDAHINVAYCSSIRSIQYVLKYVHKGCDMASFALRTPNPRDEIDVFRAARYIRPSEAFWRLFDFPIHERYPSVQTLHVHTSEDRQIVFTPENACQRAEDPPDTTLIAFLICAPPTTITTTLISRISIYSLLLIFYFPKFHSILLGIPAKASMDETEKRLRSASQRCNDFFSLNGNDRSHLHCPPQARRKILCEAAP